MEFNYDSMVEFKSDIAEFSGEFEELRKFANTALEEISDGFLGALESGKSFEDTLSQISAKLAELALNFAAEQISDGITDLFDSFLGSSFGDETDVLRDLSSEFTLPVSQRTNPTSAMPVNVVIQAQDVSSFKNSEQMVSAMMARAVKRGQRNL